LSKTIEFKLPHENMMRGKEMAMGLTESLYELGLNVEVVYKAE